MFGIPAELETQPTAAKTVDEIAWSAVFSGATLIGKLIMNQIIVVFKALDAAEAGLGGVLSVTSNN